MVYAGLAMLGLALAAIVMVLLAPRRDEGAERPEEDSPLPGAGPGGGQPGSGPDPIPASRPATGRAVSA
jgi:hypothetical protein